MPHVIFLRKSLFFSFLCVSLVCLSNLVACGVEEGQTGQTSESTTLRIVPAEQPESVRRIQTMNAQQSKTTTNPWGVALDEARGFVYVAEPGCDMAPYCKDPQTQKRVAFPTKIGKYALADGSFIGDFAQPAFYSNPLFVAVNPADGHIWFTEPNSDAIGELSPDEEIWSQTTLTANSTPYDLIFDRRGNLWFTEFAGNRIGFLNTQTHKVVETPTPTPDSHPYGLTIDRKGNLWFAENALGVAKIGTFVPNSTGAISIQEDVIDPVGGVQPHLIAATPNGHIWVSEGFQGSISEFDPTTGAVSHYKVATACRRVSNCTHISGIATDRQGNIWFTDSLNATVGYFVPSRGIARIRPLSDPTVHPHDGLVVQSNGTIWFTEQYGSWNFGPALVMWPAASISTK